VSAEHGIRFLPSVAALVLQGLGQHRLLSARQVHALHLPGVSLRYTQRILAELQEAGLAERAHAAHGIALWSATPEGRLFLRSKNRPGSHTHHSAALQTDGALRAHTLALNETGIAFVKAARARGDECDAFSWRHEVAHPLTPPRQGHKQQWLIADALLSYLEDQDQGPVLHQRFIEINLPTTSAERLTEKLSKYKTLHHCQPPAAPPGQPTEPSWRSRYRAFPQVLVVLAGQEPTDAQRRIKHLIALWHSDPATRDLATIPLHCVTLEQLTSDGPHAPIFTNADEPEQPQNWLGNTASHSEMAWSLPRPSLIEQGFPASR
jgi:hypothetical protein